MTRAVASARTLAWAPFLGAVAAAVALTALFPDGGGEAGAYLWRLRGAAFLLASGAALAFDEPCTATLAASPTSLLHRRLLRSASLLVPWGVTWALLVGWSLMHAGLPVAAVTLEATGLLAVALAVAVVGSPHAAGPVLMLLLLGSYLLQPSWPRLVTLLPGSPSHPDWVAAHVRWAGLLAGAVVTLIALSLDPARRRRGLSAVCTY